MSTLHWYATKVESEVVEYPPRMREVRGQIYSTAGYPSVFTRVQAFPRPSARLFKGAVIGKRLFGLSLFDELLTGRGLECAVCGMIHLTLKGVLLHVANLEL